MTDVSASLAPGGTPEKEARLHACLECGCSFASAGLLLQHSKVPTGVSASTSAPRAERPSSAPRTSRYGPAARARRCPCRASGGGRVCAHPPMGKGWVHCGHARRRGRGGPGTGMWLPGRLAGAQRRAVCPARGAASVLGYWSTGPHRRPGACRAQASFLRARRGAAQAAPQLPFPRPAAGYTSPLHSWHVF